MTTKSYAINGGNESIALAVVNVRINGEVKEVIPAFTKYSIRRRNLSKTMESVDETKLLPTVFGFTTADIFRQENFELKDFEGSVAESGKQTHWLHHHFRGRSDFYNRRCQGGNADSISQQRHCNNPRPQSSVRQYTPKRTR